MDQTIASQLAKILGKFEENNRSIARLNIKIENIDKNVDKKLEELSTKIFILEPSLLIFSLSPSFVLLVPSSSTPP